MLKTHHCGVLKLSMKIRHKKDIVVSSKRRKLPEDIMKTEASDDGNFDYDFEIKLKPPKYLFDTHELLNFAIKYLPLAHPAFLEF